MGKWLQVISNAKKTCGVQKGEAIQKQQLSDYKVTWLHIHVTKNFDIS